MNVQIAPDEFVKWNSMSELDKQNIKENIDQKIIYSGLANSHLFSCFDTNCKNKDHSQEIDNIFNF